MQAVLDGILAIGIALILLGGIFFVLELVIEGGPVNLYKKFLRSRKNYWSMVVVGTPSYPESNIQDFFGYSLYIGKRGEVKAGCRFFFNFEDAIKHWEGVREEVEEEYNSYYGTNNVPKEFLLSVNGRYRRANKFVEVLKSLQPQVGSAA